MIKQKAQSSDLWAFMRSKKPDEDRANRWLKIGEIFLVFAKAIKTLYDLFF